jgi:hypothetical protein
VTLELRRRNMAGQGDSRVFRTLLKSKIHRVSVTQCELHYVHEANRQVGARDFVPVQQD